jgi:hypothetical protein
MSAFLEGIGKVLGKITEHIQGRIERTKNQIKKLEAEREAILKKTCDTKAVRRLDFVESELSRLRGILEASAKD